jgi:hypothetical protein
MVVYYSVAGRKVGSHVVRFDTEHLSYHDQSDWDTLLLPEIPGY